MAGLRSRIPAGGVRSVGTGLIAQAATFGAMLIPMALGRLDQVSYIVLVAAIASIAARICGLAFPAIYPVLDERQAPQAVAASVRTVLVAAVLGVLVAAVLATRSAHLAGVVLWSTTMTVTMVCYEIVNGMFVRRSRYGDYARVRLWYGLANLGTVVAVSAVTDWTPALAASGVVSYAVGWVAGSRVLGTSVIGSVRHSGRGDTLAYIRRHRTAILAQTVDVFGSQLPALSVAGVGVATGAGIVWSGLQRIAGGVVTTFLMLVAPGLDMRVAAAVRGGDPARLRRTVASSCLTAAGLATLAALVTVPATVIVLRISRDFQVAPAMLAVLLAHCVSIFTLAAIIKYLLMMGAIRHVAFWTSLRAASALVVLLAIGGDALILAVAAHSTLWTIALLLLIRSALRGRTTPEDLPDA